jgi:ABC transporter DrrB family efflux protein
MTTMTVEPVHPVATAPRQAAIVPASVAVARRTLRKFARTPALIVVGTIQGAMFLLIFRYVFGGAINAGHLPYVDFLVPGFITTGVLFSGTAAAAGVAEDVEGGFFDRLRSLPIPRRSVLAGRAMADTVMVTWGLAVTTAIGFAVGFRIHGSEAAALAAFGLCMLFGFAFGWVFITIGLVSGSAQAAQGLSLLVFPLTFVSSAYVPVRTMPGWMQPFAEHQPVTVMVNAVRALTGGHAAVVLIGHSAGYEVTAALLWCVVLIAVFVPLATARYSRG